MAKLKKRLDHELHDQGLFESVEAAKRAVMAGQIFDELSRKPYEKPGDFVVPGSSFYVRTGKREQDMRDRFVSRGGAKLMSALEHFQLRLDGCNCLDIGCSTGGFTDCALQHGAKRVCAVDVGYGQFDWALRNDDRVDLHERTNICDFAQEKSYESYWNSFDYIFADVSFTSLAHIIDAISVLLHDEGYVLSLIKPQFEAERSQVGEKGIVRDGRVHSEVLHKVAFALHESGFQLHGFCNSGIVGTKGNREFFVFASKRSNTASAYAVLSEDELMAQIGELNL